MHKKAIFYTAAAIALTIVIFTTYSAYTANRLSERMSPIQTRVETMNFFIKSIEKDISNGALIAGYRAMLSFDHYINENNEFINDLDKRFKEIFINGTIDNQPQSLMNGYTFTDWMSKISAEASKTGIKLNFTLNDVKLDQNDPWIVTVQLNINLDVRDRLNTSYWSIEKRLTPGISIIGLNDPLYTHYNNGNLNNTIIKSTITNFVVSKNPKNLLLHTNNSWYIAHNDAPNFLMRLQGNLGSSDFGIESLVNLTEFQQHGLPILDRSVVDFIYFGAAATTNYRINRTPDWFKIDSAHLNVYQVADITCAPAECWT